METNDIVTKDFEAFPDVAADILNTLLHDGEQVVREENLLRAPTETLYQGNGDKRNQLEDLAEYEFIQHEALCVGNALSAGRGQNTVYQRHADRGGLSCGRQQLPLKP